MCKNIKVGDTIKNIGKITYIWDFKDDLKKIQVKNKKDEYLYNFVNKKGEYISEEWFTSACNFHDGICIVELKGQNKYIRKNGEFLLNDINFEMIGSFKNNLAKTRIGEEIKFIDSKGNFINHKEYKKINTSFKPTFVVFNKNKEIVQIRSSETCCKSIEEFEKEIKLENLGKTAENSFLRLCRKIRKEFNLENQPKY